MKHTVEIVELALRYPFGISRGTVSVMPTVLLDLDGRGRGEAAPVRYLGQTAPDAARLLEELASGVTEANLDDIEGHEKRAREVAPDHSAARCGFDVALWNARARAQGKPLHEVLGAPPPAGKTSYTIALAETPESMADRAREAAHLPFLKVKLGRGSEFDLAAIEAVRAAAPGVELRVDANGGWSLADARAMVSELAKLGVTLVEQPLSVGSIEETGELRAESALPIFIDEDVQDMGSLQPLRGKVDGINIKLSKCGGLSEALRMIAFARNEGWKIFLGCMVESRVGLAAAASLAGAVDYIDLDGHMLTTNDPTPPGSAKVLSPDLPL